MGTRVSGDSVRGGERRALGLLDGARALSYWKEERCSDLNQIFKVCLHVYAQMLADKNVKMPRQQFTWWYCATPPAGMQIIEANVVALP